MLFWGFLFKQSWKLELGTKYLLSMIRVIALLPLLTFRMMQQLLQDWTVTIKRGLRKYSCAENRSCQHINSFLSHVVLHGFFLRKFQNLFYNICVRVKVMFLGSCHKSKMQKRFTKNNALGFFPPKRKLFLILARSPNLIDLCHCSNPYILFSDYFFRRILDIFLTLRPVLYMDAMVTVETLMINKYKAWNHNNIYCINTSQIDMQNSGSFNLQNVQQLHLTLWYIFSLNSYIYYYSKLWCETVI